MATSNDFKLINNISKKIQFTISNELYFAIL